MRRTHRIVTAVVAVVLSAGAGLSPAQPSPGGAPAADRPAEPGSTVKGTVVGMNLSADGEPNGLLLKTGDGRTPVQINFPPHMAAAIGTAVKVGTAVTAQTRPVPPRPAGPGGPKDGPKGGPGGGPDDRPAPPPPADRPAPPEPGDRPAPPAPPGPADHPVSELVSLTPDGGQAIVVIRPDEMPTVTAKGSVARLNYTREGQPDGVVLDDGTFVHLGPKETADLKPAVGQAMDVEGVRPPKAGDAKVIRATKVNGTAIERPRPGPPKP